jgi:DNA-binding NtrC family response regulator
VLVVEDDACQREVLSEILTDLGVGVSTAKDGREGLEILRQQTITAVLTDIYMPAMNGLEFLSSSQATGPCPPFIISTGSDSAALMISAVRCGAVEFLQKPFNREDLSQCLERTLAVAARRLHIARLLAEVGGSGAPGVADRVAMLERLVFGDGVAGMALRVRS